jgi:serine/threonine protein kinase
MADKDNEPAQGKASEPSFSQIQKAAELLKIRKFAQTTAAFNPAAAVPAAAPAVAAPPAMEAPIATPAPEKPPVAARPQAVADAPAPRPVAPAAAPPAVPAPAAAAAPVASTEKSQRSMAEPVSVAAPSPAVPPRPAAAPPAKPAVTSAVVVESQVPPAAARQPSSTVVHPEAQAAQRQAEPSLPSDYAELKRQALLKAQAQMPQASRLALPVGTNLQEYTIEWTLGIGGFGITYLAMDTNLEAEVAVKEYFPSDMCARDADGMVRVKTPDEEPAFKEGLDKFLKECRVLANFKHPNVVRVSRFFQANNTAYMVMDYESGESFKDWLPKRKTMDETMMLKMILPLLDGLDVVHKAGFLHRDIKPANIYVRQDDNMVLLDFGAARHAVGTRSRSLTTIVTPGYAPFEQYHSHGKQGPWTDLYAFGGMLYWVITGAKPVEAPARIKTDGMVPAVKAGAGRFSPSFLAAVDWALVPDENKRPQSVADFKSALTAPTPVAMPVAPPATKTIKAEPKPSQKPQEDPKKSWWKPW